MDHSDEYVLVSDSWPWWRKALLGLSVLGLILSAYLSWHYIAGKSVIGCGDGSSCEKVLASRWSSIGGILPVSGLAAGAYLAILMALFFIGPTTETSVRRLAWRAILILAGAAAGSAIWFTILQKWIIKAFCPWCMATHATGILLTLLVLVLAPRQFSTPTPDSPSPRRLVPPMIAVGQTLFGLILASILAVCQVIFVPPSVYSSGELREKPPVAKLGESPMIGSADAPYVVNLFFDYRCSHCRMLHGMIDEAIKRYNGKLAFALRPAPLNTQCNPHIGRDRNEYRDSCELAKISLAVWFAKPQAFASFDNWIYASDNDQPWSPRSLEEAQAKAAELIAPAAYDAARQDSRVEEYMQKSIEIYGLTVDNTGNSLPRLSYASRWVSPEPNDVDDFIKILHDSLGLPQP